MSGSAGLPFFEAGRWENELWGMLHGSDAGGQDVITNGQVVGLVLEFASGETQKFRLDCEYGDQATYANGTRVFMTPAEVCMKR